MKTSSVLTSVINTLLACLDEDEISSLIPCAINFNNQSSLFEYAKFVRKIDHSRCVRNIETWLELSSRTTINKYQRDCRVQKLVNVIYHTIMRQGSNLQVDLHCYCLPKLSILTTYNPGIINLRSIVIVLNNHTNQESIEILSILSKFCSGIINFELYTVYTNYIAQLLSYFQILSSHNL